MKKILSIMAIAAVALGLASCSSSDGVPLSDLSVTVSVPTEVDGFTVDATASDLEVTLTNTVDNSTTSARTDAAGSVLFMDLAAGSYSVSAGLTTAVGVNKINLIGNGTVTLVAGEDGTYTLSLVGSVKQDDLVISEIYMTTPGFVTMAHLQCKFFEIYNNTDHALTTEGVMFGSVAGRVGTTPDSDRLWSSSLPIGEKIYLSNLVRFPNDNIITLQPGEGLVVASNAVNYAENLPDTYDPADFPDLTGASFECYAVDYLQNLGVTGSTFFDTNNANVENIEILYMYNQHMNSSWLNWSSVGESYVLIRDTNFTMSASLMVEEPEDTTDPKTQYVTMDANTVIDGVCMMANSEAAAYVNLPATIDGSFTYYKADGGAMSSGISLVRQKDEAASTAAGHTVLVDTNNSASDFTQAPVSSAFVYGE